MEIGIDSFAGIQDNFNIAEARRDSIIELLDCIKKADEVGIDIFGIGEHHREEYLDSANAMILSAAAALTTNIRLTSAVTVLSAADPVRVFQSFATLDLISSGRAEMVVGRGSFTEAFPLFGLRMEDYNALFKEKLELLLKIRGEDKITWSGRFRPALENQPIYPRPFQKKLPIWLGVGGTPASFQRAGALGLPLMVAIIGGETHRFRPLVDLYRKAGMEAGFAPDSLKVGVHSLGFVAENDTTAFETYYPGYKKSFDKIGLDRGWPPITRSHFDQQVGPLGALAIGSPKTVAEKIQRHSSALGGIDRFSFQMDPGSVTHEQFIKSIELIGQEVKPLLN